MSETKRAQRRHAEPVAAPEPVAASEPAGEPVMAVRITAAQRHLFKVALLNVGVADLTEHMAGNSFAERQQQALAGLSELHRLIDSAEFA